MGPPSPGQACPRPLDEARRQVLDGHQRWDGHGHLLIHGRGRLERLCRGVLHVSEVPAERKLYPGGEVCEAIRG